MFVGIQNLSSLGNKKESEQKQARVLEEDEEFCGW